MTAGEHDALWPPRSRLRSGAGCLKATALKLQIFARERAATSRQRQRRGGSVGDLHKVDVCVYVAMVFCFSYTCIAVSACSR